MVGLPFGGAVAPTPRVATAGTDGLGAGTATTDGDGEEHQEGDHAPRPLYYTVPQSFAGPGILGAYFPYGRGIVEGFAYHPGEQSQGNTGDPNSKKLAAVFYGNKFVHATEGLGPGTNPNALETRTFPNGTLIIPMDAKQADVVLAFGFMHALLRNNTYIYRVIEPPDVNLKTQGQPAGSLFQGGPVMVMPGSSTTFMQVHQSFSTVSYDTLRTEFTSNRVFIVAKPTRILLIKGAADWGETQFLLNDMKIPYTMTSTGAVDGNPDMLMSYDLAVDDCGGWDTEYGGSLPANTAAKMREFAMRGGEMIYTDRALGELERAFPNYIPVVQYGPTRVVDGNMINVPEFPGQYYGNSVVKLYQLGSGAEMNAPVAPEVRVMAYHSPAGSAPTISLTAPSGGTLNGGSAASITWSASGGSAPLEIDLHYSVSGSAGPWIDIAKRIANSGSRSWTVPYIPTTAGLVRATVWDLNWRTATSTSAAPFTISAPQLKMDVGLSAMDNTLVAGSNTSVTARALDSFGPVQNATVSFTSAIGGSFNPASAATDSSGFARTTYTAPAAGAQTKGRLSASASKATHLGGSGFVDMTVNPSGQAALDVALILKPPVLHSGDTAYVHVKVTDGSAPQSGAALTAAASAGLLTPTTATTNSTGEAVFAYTLPTTAAPMPVNVVVNGTKSGFLDGTGTAGGTLFPMLDLQLVASAQKGSLNASEKTKIFVHVESNSQSMPAASLTFTLTGPGTISAASGVSNGTGDFELEYTAPSSVPSKTTASVLVRAMKAGYSSAERPVWISLNAPVDSSPPYVVSTSPAKNANGVPLNTTITIQWNESMDQVSAQTAFSMMPVVQCGWSWPSGDRQICTPSSALQATTTYDVTITNSARDLAGNKMLAAYQYSFTTGTSGGGGTVPAVAGTSPSDGAVDVPLDSTLIVKFSIAMSKPDTEAAFSAAPSIPGAFSWGSADTELTLTPSPLLKNATKYMVTISTGAKSSAGVPLPNAFSFSFTTAAGGGGQPIPPKVASTVPKDGATGVALNANIVVNFDMEMDRLATEGAVSSMPSVTGRFSWSPNGGQITWDPDSDLSGDTDYAVTVSTAAKSKAGAQMASQFKFSFRTGAAPDTTPPVIAHAPVSGATEGTAIPLTATVTDDRAVASVEAKYRKVGEASFKTLALPSSGGDSFAGTIPAGDVVVGTIEYYIEAKDASGNGAVSPAGGAGAPNKITVSAKGPSDGGDGGPGTILGLPAAMFIGLVVAVAAIAALAVVFALKRRRKKEEPPQQAPAVDMWGAPAGQPWDQGQQGYPEEQQYQQ
jgi:hypothetical protein